MKHLRTHTKAPKSALEELRERIKKQYPDQFGKSPKKGKR